MLMSSLKICELEASVEKEWGQAVDPDPWDPYVTGLPDPDPSLFCTDPDPFINKQKKLEKP